MIISCENCSKKFEIDDNLIPSTGRLLQCGSCSHKWHYKPKQEQKFIKVINEKDFEKNQDFQNKNEIINDTVEISIKKNQSILEENLKNNTEKSKNSEDQINLKKISYFNYLLVMIISFVSILIILDTFNYQLVKFFPKLNFYLDSFYETLRDISLFFKDLI